MLNSKIKNGPQKTVRYAKMSILLALFFTLFSILPIFILFFVVSEKSRNTIYSKVRKDMYFRVHSCAADLDLYMKDRTKIVSMIADMQLLSMLSEAKIDRTQFADKFEHIIANTDFSDSMVFSNDGSLLYASKFISGVKSIDDKIFENTQILDVYKRVKDSGKAVISALSLNNVNKVPSVYIGAAIFSEDVFRGVYIAAVDINRIFTMSKPDWEESGIRRQICVFDSNTGVSRILLADGSGNLTLEQSPILYTNKDVPFKNTLLPSLDVGVEAQSPESEKIFAVWDYVPSLRWYVVSTIDISRIENSFKYAETYVIMLSCLMFLASAFAAFVISRILLSPVNKIIRQTDLMLKGNFVAPEPISAHLEFKLLSSNFSSLREVMANLLKVSLLKCLKLIKQISAISERTRQRRMSLARAEASAMDVQQKAFGISQNTKALKETLNSVLTVTEDTVVNAEGGLVHIKKIDSSMSDLKSFSAELLSQLEALYGSAELIEKVVETMQNVADKTNLLSLNAAIESKKAGDYGKGFSVVAAEIARLANQTANSTIEIEKGISAMMSSVNTGIGGMNVFHKKVNSSYEDMMVVTAHLTGIIQRVQGLPARILSAIDVIANQSDSSSEICENIAELKSEIAIIIAAVADTESVAARMRETAESLRDDLGSFKS